MVDATVVSVDPPPILTSDYDSGLSVPPLDTAFFSQQLSDGIVDDQNVIDDDGLDFDFSFDDLDIPTADELDDLLNPAHFPEFDCQPGCDANFPRFAPNLDHHDVFRSAYSELFRTSGEGELSGDRSSNGSGVLKSVSSGLESHQVSDYLNATSQDSNGSSRGGLGNCGSDVKVMNCPSPESMGSGNCGSNGSENSNHCNTRSVISSPNSNSSSIKVGVVDQKIKFDEPQKNKVNSSLLKRKKNCEDLQVSAVVSRTNKSRKSNCDSEIKDNTDDGGVSGEDEKRKARLIRNRESAQLSRQRKKHYVDELEEKVRRMNSTIQDLNAKISYFMAENVTLRQQMGGNGAVPPPPVAPPPPGLYPHPGMMYPWMPYAPPYMMKPHGSQVPLVPIPRLKPQETAQAPKMNKKVESKKKEGPKTKKVAGISFLGLLFFIMLFGGLAPMINMRYGGVRETLTGGESYVGGGFYEKHHGRVLMVNGSESGEKYDDKRYSSSKSSLQCHDSGGIPNVDEAFRLGNESEPLVASLYVPRNDKLVKIDGNLIIHSVLASEKAMSAHGSEGDDTGLAVPGDLGPAIPVPGVRRDASRHPQLMALGSSSAQEDSRSSKANDGRLQQWFREGLAGPMLSSGMCTEVFQFELSSASASGAIIPATTARNISKQQSHNSTHPTKRRNRRILHDLPIPLPDSSHNFSNQHAGRSSQQENLPRNNSTSPMVVSVLVDPREAGDAADRDGVMGAKSLPRIFVVVLIDSVKYVTYSCMLPFKGSALPLVVT